MKYRIRDGLPKRQELGRGGRLQGHQPQAFIVDEFVGRSFDSIINQALGILNEKADNKEDAQFYGKVQQIVENKPTLDWCDRCGEWHESGVLNICTLKKAHEKYFGGEPEPKRIAETGKQIKKPWEVIE